MVHQPKIESKKLLEQQISLRGVNTIRINKRTENGTSTNETPITAYFQSYLNSASKVSIAY
jgi:hypothetical protein